MTAATADATTSIWIRTPDYTHAPMRSPDMFGAYIRLLIPPMRHLSDYKLEAQIYIPSPIKPQWFANTQRRIRDSVVPNYHKETHAGRWISQQVADAANMFLQNTADLLPGEPFIYSSSLGDLVAEFKTEHGSMTTIVSPAFALLFAVIDGVPVERRVFKEGDVREEVRQLTGLLRMRQHDAVETK